MNIGFSMLVLIALCAMGWFMRRWMRSTIDTFTYNIEIVLEDNNKTRDIAKNAQGIASNALSSAQRAESKINKTIKKEEKENA